MLLTIKKFVIIGSLTTAALLLAGYQLYNTGYDNGVEYVNKIVTKDRILWEEKIRDLQHKSQLENQQITLQHKQVVSDLETKIATLEKDNTILKKYSRSTIKLPAEFILLHDRSVKQIPLDKEIKMIDPNKSYTLEEFGAMIHYNYNVCNMCYDRLESLQKIVKSYIEKQQQITNKAETP